MDRPGKQCRAFSFKTHVKKNASPIVADASCIAAFVLDADSSGNDALFFIHPLCVEQSSQTGMDHAKP